MVGTIDLSAETGNSLANMLREAADKIDNDPESSEEIKKIIDQVQAEFDAITIFGETPTGLARKADKPMRGEAEISPDEFIEQANAMLAQCPALAPAFKGLSFDWSDFGTYSVSVVDGKIQLKNHAGC